MKPVFSLTLFGLQEFGDTSRSPRPQISRKRIATKEQLGLRESEERGRLSGPELLKPKNSALSFSSMRMNDAIVVFVDADERVPFATLVQRASRLD